MDKPLTSLRKRPAQTRAAVTFNAILDAAAHILRAGGTQALSTNKIAEKAGVSIGSLYQYFPNKQAIARALIERHINRMETARPSVLDDPRADAATVMHAAITWHFEMHKLDPRFAEALRELAGALLPIEEQTRLAALRRDRVAATVTRLMGPRASKEALMHAIFLVDTCLRAIATETMQRRSEWLTSEEFSQTAAGILAACFPRGEHGVNAPI